MRRRRFRKPTLSLSLFPFLAVLVCTMGAIIVLLVTVVQKARVDVDLAGEQLAEQQSAVATELTKWREEKEIHDWRRQVLEAQHDEIAQKLRDQRLTLSHLEDHIRRLEEKWRQLQQQAREIEQIGESHQRGQAAVAEELAQLRAATDKARKELEEARRAAANRRQTFAVIPYEGPNGTKRRPIYIECTDAGVILQPEGIVLSPADFEGSLGPGNPLDAALRTTREYLARVGDSKIHGEPYPLLIVRPNGTVAYAVARAAIKSWDDEFGYELVDDQMELEFPKPDSTLRAELERSIADARSRQTLLALAMPGRFGRSPVGGLVATTSGGFRPAGGSSHGRVGGGQPNGIGAEGQHSGGVHTSFSRVFHQASAPGGSSSGEASRGTRRVPGTSGTGESGEGGTAQQGSTGGRSAPGGAASSGGVPGGSSPFGSSQPSGTGSGGPAGWSTPNMGSALAPPSDPQSSPSGEASSQADGSAAGSATVNLGSRKRSSVKPLANSRGENWGNPRSSAAATAYTRYISVQCLANQLVILPEDGDYRSKIVIAAPGELHHAMDEFVSAIWKRMESWGIAAENGYWKPVLRVAVAADAEARFEELSTLLERSGLVVERR